MGQCEVGESLAGVLAGRSRLITLGTRALKRRRVAVPASLFNLTPKVTHRVPANKLMNESKTNDGTLLKSTDLLSSPLTHLVVLHRVLYGAIDKAEALEYLHSHLREDADLADMGRPLKYQYKDNE